MKRKVSFGLNWKIKFQLKYSEYPLPDVWVYFSRIFLELFWTRRIEKRKKKNWKIGKLENPRNSQINFVKSVETAFSCRQIFPWFFQPISWFIKTFLYKFNNKKAYFLHFNTRYKIMTDVACFKLILIGQSWFDCLNRNFSLCVPKNIRENSDTPIPTVTIF